MRGERHESASLAATGEINSKAKETAKGIRGESDLRRENMFLKKPFK
jgi:hypothetical protein